MEQFFPYQECNDTLINHKIDILGLGLVLRLRFVGRVRGKEYTLHSLLQLY